MIDEQKLRELCSNATPGPWSFVRHTCGLNGEHDARDDWTVYGADGDSVCTEGSAPALADPEFIASANPVTITALLDELQNLRNDRDSWAEQCSQRVQDAVDAFEKLEAMTQERTAWRVTAENAESAVKQARIDALEEAKKAVDSEGFSEPESEYEAGYNKACDVCVSAIEYLKETQ